MKTARRHELQTNTLADWLGDSIESAKPYAKLIGGIVLAGVVLVIFYGVMQSRSRQDDERGWQRYYQAITSETPSDLEQVAKDFPNSPAGYCSHLLAADRRLTDGCNELFTDRSKAKNSLQSAVKGYQAAMPAKDPLIKQRAIYGLAKAYEAQPNLDEARNEYKKLIQQFPKGVFAGVAQKRLDDLDRTATKEFYDWFAQQRPLPRPTGMEGFGSQDGTKSPFLGPGSGMPDDDAHRSAFPFSAPSQGEGDDMPDDAGVPDDGATPGDKEGATSGSDEAASDGPDLKSPAEPKGEPEEGGVPPSDEPKSE